VLTSKIFGQTSGASADGTEKHVFGQTGRNKDEGEQNEQEYPIHADSGVVSVCVSVRGQLGVRV
jgi:hypothetical protein